MLTSELITLTGRNAIDGLYRYRPFTFASVPLDASIQECRSSAIGSGCFSRGLIVQDQHSFLIGK